MSDSIVIINDTSGDDIQWWLGLPGPGSGVASGVLGNLNNKTDPPTVTVSGLEPGVAYEVALSSIGKGSYASVNPVKPGQEVILSVEID